QLAPSSHPAGHVLAHDDDARIATHLETQRLVYRFAERLPGLVSISILFGEFLDTPLIGVVDVSHEVGGLGCGSLFGCRHGRTDERHHFGIDLVTLRELEKSRRSPPIAKKLEATPIGASRCHLAGGPIST